MNNCRYIGYMWRAEDVEAWLREMADRMVVSSDSVREQRVFWLVIRTRNRLRALDREVQG